MTAATPTTNATRHRDEASYKAGDRLYQADSHGVPEFFVVQDLNADTEKCTIQRKPVRLVFQDNVQKAYDAKWDDPPTAVYLVPMDAVRMLLKFDNQPVVVTTL